VTAAPDHDQAAAAAAQLDPDAQLDLLDRELTRRRRERDAEGERVKARAYTCSRCGAGESWRAGRGLWFHDDRGPVCSACDLDRRSFQRPDGAISSDAEHRARIIAELIGPELARYQWPPLLVARAPELLPWWHETPGARAGERFAYVDREALAASLHAPPPPPPKLHSRGRRYRCPGCGARGEVWSGEQVGVSAPTASDGGRSSSLRAHFRITWTCRTCRHQDVEQRPEQHPDLPVRALTTS
jgi:hypothetical protein